MHKATIAVFALAAITGCGKKAEKAPETGSGSAPVGSGTAPGSGSAVVAAGSGSGSGSAPAVPVKGACFTSKQGMIESFTVDDKTATICAKLGIDELGAKQCLALDLASGAWSPGKPPPKPEEIEKPIDIAKLHLPKPSEGAKYTVTASADGAQLITTVHTTPSAVVLFDAKTHKRVKTIPLGDDSGNCLEEAYFVGETIFAITSVCAGPGGTGNFLTKDGTPLGKMDPTHNIYGAVPLLVDGDRWALAEFGSNGFDIVDAKAGKELSHYDVPDQGDCADCMDTSGPVFAADPLKKLPSGKLALISNSGISIVDAKTLTAVKPVRIPVCPASVP